MTDDRVDKIRTLFNTALEHEGSERDAFLDEACGGDRSIREEVESLIDAFEKNTRFLESPSWSEFVGPDAGEGPESAGLEAEPGLPFERLGEFRLIRRLGEGGMGVVYLAVQESLGRQVALKITRQDRIGSLEAAARFWREIEAVSGLRHPNIVTVFGSDEEEGVRYFAMELIPGRGFDEILRDAAAQGKKIPAPTILRWIHEIADALDCAHQAGIIHRDVKPSNIRITPEGRAMLMDFGIARHTMLSSLTLAGEFRGTPRYASPEQIRAGGKKIDARTDIYSLGATLYEAVAGRVPFDGETTEQVFQQVLQEEPVPPRRLNPAISRDLDTVILASLEKERSRRYRTVVDFAGDLHGLLTGGTIRVRPAGLGAKVWKRIRRNPLLSAATGIALAAVVTLLVYGAWSYAQITKETKKQVAVIAFLEDMLLAPDLDREGKDVRVVEILESALADLDGAFGEEPEIEALLRSTIGKTYYALGLYKEAEQQISAALATREDILGSGHRETLTSMSDLSLVFWKLGRIDEAETLQRRALDGRRRKLGRDHEDTLDSMNSLATVLVDRNKLAEAESIFRELMATRSRVVGEEDSSTLTSMNNLGNLFYNQGKLSEAEGIFRRIVEIQTRAMGEKNSVTLTAMNNLAFILGEEGKFDEAEKVLRRALEIRKQELGEDHSETLTSMNLLGTFLYRLGKYSDAESLFGRVLELRIEHLGEEHHETLTSMNNLAAVLLIQGRLSEAESIHRKALEIKRRDRGEDHPSTLRSKNNLALVLKRKGDFAGAEPLYREVLEAQIRSPGREHPDTLSTQNNLAALLMAMDRLDEADSIFSEIMTIAAKSPEELGYAVLTSRVRYGECLISLERYEEARIQLQIGYDGSKAAHGEKHSLTRDAQTLLQEASAKVEERAK